MPKTERPWSLTSLREKLIKIGAKVVSHGRYVTFQLAEVAVPRQLFADILSLPGCGHRPHPHDQRWATCTGYIRGRGMPRDKLIGRVSALECVSRRPQSPLARGNDELPLPKPVRSAILAAKPPESGECRIMCLPRPFLLLRGRGGAEKALQGAR
jgi:hypothetical protein